MIEVRASAKVFTWGRRTAKPNDGVSRAEAKDGQPIKIEEAILGLGVVAIDVQPTRKLEYSRLRPPPGTHECVDCMREILLLLRAASTTLAPSVARWRAAASPMPRLAPVTMATRSHRSLAVSDEKDCKVLTRESSCP